MKSKNTRGPSLWLARPALHGWDFSIITQPRESPGCHVKPESGKPRDFNELDLVVCHGGSYYNAGQGFGQRTGEKEGFFFFFFLSGVQTSVDATTQCLLVPTQGWLSVM